MNEQLKKKKLWISLLGLLILMLLVAGGCFVWSRYLSPQAKSERETQKNYEKYLAWQANYEKAMKEDIYGGKTPEETLTMFIAALKKEDIEEAVKYFALEDNENSEDYLTRKKWEEGLRKAKEKEDLQKISRELETARLTETSPVLKTAWFGIFDEKGVKKHDIFLKLNEYSQVWKIESL